MLQLTDNALTVLKARYLRRDRSGQVVESPEDLCRRVSGCVARAEAQFGKARAVTQWQEGFFEALSKFDFMSNSPTLMNAGTPLGQLSACFVLPVEDPVTVDRTGDRHSAIADTPSRLVINGTIPKCCPGITTNGTIRVLVACP